MFLCSLFFLYLNPQLPSADLVVSVKDGGGDIIEEFLSGNATQDITTLEWARFDGVKVTVVHDFKKFLLLLRAVIPRDELIPLTLSNHVFGKETSLTLCFLSTEEPDYIPPEAMWKLRQKNPTALRTAEEDKGWEQIVFDRSILPEEVASMSPTAKSLCSSALSTTFIKPLDSPALNEQEEDREISLCSDLFSLPEDELNEVETKRKFQPCRCNFSLHIPWYPCGLKYCQGRDESGRPQTYRCGIRSCSKGYHLQFPFSDPIACTLWTR